MKRIIPVVFSLFVVCRLAAQSDFLKISADIRKLSVSYFTDFKGIKGALKTEDEKQKVYYSKFKITGSVDSTNLLYQDKTSKSWTFSARMIKESITIDELESMAGQIIFPFGKLKSIASGVEWVLMYVPEKKKKVHEKVKLFNLSFYNGRLNPEDKTGDALLLKMGAEESHKNN